MDTAATLAPAIIMAMPIPGCPANANTAPSPNVAPPTSTPMVCICPPILSFNVVHTMFTALHSRDSAATIMPIPRPIFPLLNANIAPTASPPPNAASTAPITSLILSGMPSQFATIALPIVTAPVAISARPSGTFAPESASSAPTASSAAPTIIVILERESCSAVSIAFPKPWKPLDSGRSSNIYSYPLLYGEEPDASCPAIVFF